PTVRDLLIDLDPHRRDWPAGIWSGLFAPFALTMPGVRVVEIDACEEAGEEWRQLRVVVPASRVAPASAYVYSFNSTGLLLRYDRASMSTYAADHRSFDGLVMATRHRFIPINSNGRACRASVLTSIDVLDIQVDYHGY